MAGQMDTEAVRDAEEVFGKSYNEFSEDEKSRADKMRLSYAAVVQHWSGLVSVLSLGHYSRRVRAK